VSAGGEWGYIWAEIKRCRLCRTAIIRLGVDACNTGNPPFHPKLITHHIAATAQRSSEI
jgi:hypothetical protein